MLRWRLLVGIPLVCFVVFLCWVDAIALIPGVALMPFYLVCVFFMTKELLQLLNAGGIYPRRTTVYLGIFGTILLCWFSCYNSLPIIARLENAVASAFHEENATETTARAGDDPTDRELGAAAKALETAKQAVSAAEQTLENARARKAKRALAREGLPESSDERASSVEAASDSAERAWKTATFAGIHILLAFAAGVLVAFIGEMARFKQPGGHAINLTGAVFAIAYVGLLGSFMVMLRIAYGVVAVLSMAIITKLCDVGAYTVGRICGRHKMAPSLSPGKTIEGGIGGLLFAVFGAWFSRAVLFPIALGHESQMTWLGVVVYGVAVGAAGAVGDLAESFIKRDAMRKDSGSNVPGFGGFLDVFDSLLIASPVAFALWAFRVVQ